MAGQLTDIVRNCKHATLISLKKETGNITFKEQVRLRMHLLFCDACKNFIKQSAIINTAMKQLQQSFFKQPPHILSSDLKQSIQQQIDSLNKQ